LGTYHTNEGTDENDTRNIVGFSHARVSVELSLALHSFIHSLVRILDVYHIGHTHTHLHSLYLLPPLA
jgi:hypothetical protein